MDTSGFHAGTRVLGDADGVPVELLHGSEVVDRTTTADGIYSFSGLRPGDYVARSRVIGDIGDRTNPMVIAVADVAAADTLRLVSRGDLLPIPNPFVDTTQVYFTVPDTMWVEVSILDVGGNVINSLLAVEARPARHRLIWNGRDQRGRPVAGSLFWVTYVAGQEVRAHLLFREGSSALDPGGRGFVPMNHGRVPGLPGIETGGPRPSFVKFLRVGGGSKGADLYRLCW